MEHQSVNKPNAKGNITRLYLVAFLFLGIVTFFMLYTRENEIQLSESEFWFEFVPNILTTVMLVTIFCWWLYDVDRLKMLVTESFSLCLFIIVFIIFSGPNLSSTLWNRSPAYFVVNIVTDIDNKNHLKAWFCQIRISRWGYNWIRKELQNGSRKSREKAWIW